MTSHLLASLLGGLLIAHTASAVCDVCGVRNDHTAKDYSTPFQEPLSEHPACQRYQQASCCDSKIVQNIAAGHDIYNSETETYDVAACDADPAVPRKVSAECKAFFEAEFCFYECDVNLSKYRCAFPRPARPCVFAGLSSGVYGFVPVCFKRTRCTEQLPSAGASAQCYKIRCWHAGGTPRVTPRRRATLGRSTRCPSRRAIATRSSRLARTTFSVSTARAGAQRGSTLRSSTALATAPLPRGIARRSQTSTVRALPFPHMHVCPIEATRASALRESRALHCRRMYSAWPRVQRTRRVCATPSLATPSCTMRRTRAWSWTSRQASPTRTTRRTPTWWSRRHVPTTT